MIVAAGVVMMPSRLVAAPRRTGQSMGGKESLAQDAQHPWSDKRRTALAREPGLRPELRPGACASTLGSLGPGDFLRRVPLALPLGRVGHLEQRDAASRGLDPGACDGRHLVCRDVQDLL